MASGTDVWCGVDIGTTHIKAVLVGHDASLVSMARAATPVTSDGFGACHDPEQIRATAERVMCQAQREARRPTRIVAVGVTSVGEEGVPLGPAGELLYPAIAWYERRPSAPERRWSARHDAAEMFAVTGLHKDLGFTIFKWLWLKGAQPEVWARCRSWLGIADYVIWRWTGQRVMSVSHASRTGLFDLPSFRWRQDWAAEVLACGTGTLPPLHDAGSPVGYLRTGVVPDLVTAREVPVVVTGLDHTVGAYAAGVSEPGRVLDSMGTAEAVIEPVPAGYLRQADLSLGTDFSAGVVPGSHIAIAGLESGAGISALRQALGATSPAEQEELESAAISLPPGADGLVYIPSRMRSGGGGALFGHKVSHGRADLYRAVVEGWALAAAEVLWGLGDPARMREVVCIGGGSRSRLWTRVKASILGREVRCVTTPEMVSVGAALLAGQAVAQPGAASRPVGGWQPATSVVAPEPEWVPAYRELAGTFRRLAAVVHPGLGAHVYP